MFILQTIPPNFGLRNPSSFSLKAETLLRLGGFTYERVDARPDKAPKRKLPVLKDGDVVVPDSAHIQAYLEAHHGARWDAGLSAAQLAEAAAFRALVEDQLYFVMSYALWVEHGDEFREGAFQAVPGVIRRLVFNGLRRKVVRGLDAQGLGRHSRAEIFAFGVDSLRALEARLAGVEFFFGANPTSIDASVYGMLHSLLRGPFENPLSSFARNSAVLPGYEARVDASVFGPSDAELAAE